MPLNRFETLRSSSMAMWIIHTLCSILLKHLSSRILHRYNGSHGRGAEALTHRSDDSAGDPLRMCLWLQSDGNDRPAQRNRLSGAAAAGAGWPDSLPMGKAVHCGCRAPAAKEIPQAHSSGEGGPAGLAQT